jgi:hypothetical protein
VRVRVDERVAVERMGVEVRREVGVRLNRIAVRVEVGVRVPVAASLVGVRVNGEKGVRVALGGRQSSSERQALRIFARS